MYSVALGIQQKFVPILSHVLVNVISWRGSTSCKDVAKIPVALSHHPLGLQSFVVMLMFSMMFRFCQPIEKKITLLGSISSNFLPPRLTWALEAKKAEEKTIWWNLREHTICQCCPRVKQVQNCHMTVRKE